jgi:hypothetical protein
MNEPAPPEPARREAAPPEPASPDRARHRRGLPILLVSIAAIGAAQAAAWFYFRKQQPVTDELTRDRLEPRSRS